MERAQCDQKKWGPEIAPEIGKELRVGVGSICWALGYCGNNSKVGRD